MDNAPIGLRPSWPIASRTLLAVSRLVSSFTDLSALRAWATHIVPLGVVRAAEFLSGGSEHREKPTEPIEQQPDHIHVIPSRLRSGSELHADPGFGDDR
jgi:hypothetical protein